MPARCVPVTRLACATLLVCAGLNPCAAAGAPDAADRRFGATYDVSFLGLTVGEADLVVTRAGDRYTLDLSGHLRGLLGFFLDGSGTATVSGRFGRQGAVSATFAIDSRYANKPIRVAMRILEGRAVESTVDPEPTPRPDRVALRPQDRIGIVDPLSMLLVPVGTGEPEPGLCDRRLPVFDGASRADLVLSRGSRITVAEGPYRGPAIACRVRWVPVAGHRAQGPNVRRMAANDDMQVWLAPALDGTLLPLSISVATGWGTVRFEARRWGLAEPSPTTAGRTSVRVSLPPAR